MRRQEGGTRRGPFDAVPDSTLLQQFCRGDQEAASCLYRRYARRLRAVVRVECGTDLAPRLDAEDVVQATFLCFFRRAAAGHYRVGEGEGLWGLLAVIARNQVRSAGEYHRADKRDVRLTRHTPALEKVPDGRHSTSGAEASLLVDEVLANLPATARRIVRLRLEGYEVAEVSEQTGRSKRSVERLLQDLRRDLAPEGETPSRR
jgi:RNA polymerase sigma-70 factor (ECF subfamily)